MGSCSKAKRKKEKGKEEVLALEGQLQEKDELVAALTGRLELAAEQLDRMQRTGGDRAVRLNGGIPPELIESQKTLTDDLQQAVAQWDEMQSAAVLGRIEVQIADLRALISERSTVSGTITAGSAEPDTNLSEPDPFVSDRSNSDRPSSDSSSSDSSGSKSADGQLTGWEALKAGLMEADNDQTDEVKPDQTAGVETDRSNGAEKEPQPDAKSVETAADSAEFDSETEEPFDAELPEQVDFETATPEELQDAIERRDSFILLVLNRLRTVQRRRAVVPDWTALDNVPEELQKRLEQLECRLEDMLRVSAVELSLERAKLGREAMKLHQIELQVEKQKNLLGMSMADGDPAGGKRNDNGQQAGSQGEKGGRWMKFLGVKPDGGGK